MHMHVYMQITQDAVCSDISLSEEWIESITRLIPCGTEVSSEALHRVGKSLIEKMIHSECNEFLKGQMTLVTRKNC